MIEMRWRQLSFGDGLAETTPSPLGNVITIE